MKAFQFIYTKLPPEDSPWHKQGFHTAFYPTALLEREDVTTLEAHIHVPEWQGFNRKQTVFYHTLQGLAHLVILDIRNLPEERDTHGRGGIHLCQGFLFPPELWRATTTPLALFGLVQDAVFSDRMAVLASPRVDRKTGDIAPIEITAEQLTALPQTLPPLASDFERRLALLLNRLAETEAPPLPLLFRGTPEQVTDLLNRLIAYLPDDLKPRIGWDAALDGGTLIYFPLKIAGFSREPPLGGSPLLFDLDTRTFQEQAGHAAYFQPRTPYQHWLNACPEEATDKAHLERAYSLSCALLANQPLPSAEPASFPGFAAANRSLIEERFLSRCQPLFGASLARHIAAAVPSALKLDLLLQDLPLAPLAEIIESTILVHRLTPQDGQFTLPAALVETGSPRLHLLSRVWQGQALNSEDLTALENPQREELIRYLLLTQGATSWLRQILQTDEALFEICLAAPETSAAVQHLLLDCLRQDPDLAGIASRLLPEILAQQQGFALLNGQADLFGCLETLLRRGGWDRKTIKPLLAWTRRQELPESGFPYLQAFCQPERGIAPEVLDNATVRDSLLECLIAHHGYNIQELMAIGFAAAEVDRFAAWTNQGWWTRLKRVFKS